MPNIQLVEYTRSIGPYSEELVAVFNPDVITAESVTRKIQEETAEQCKDIIVTRKTQYENVFGGLPEIPVRITEKPVKDFLRELPSDERVTEYQYRAKHQGVWYDVVRLNKSKKVFTLACDDGTNMSVSHHHIERVKDYVND